MSDNLLAQPIILIGAGRSGSTLFVRMLNSHPKVQFKGETDFLVARLWRELWDDCFWLKSQYNMLHRLPGLTSSGACEGQMPPEMLDDAQQRAAPAVRQLFSEILQVDTGFAAWGFKEIWNGNDAVAQVPWSVYDAIFPAARWVHLVRDPFAFAQSSAKWNEKPITTKLLAEELRHWRQVVQWSRKLTGRACFFEVRFEDLIAEPEACLAPILASVGLSWHEDCGRELEKHFVASRRAAPRTTAQTLQHAQIERMIDGIPGLKALMGQLEYAPPRQLKGIEQGNETRAALARRIRKAVKRYIRPTGVRRSGGRI